MAALEVVDVHAELGHYIHEPWECKECGNEWQKRTEKASDVNLALHLVNDARLGLFDRVLGDRGLRSGGDGKKFRACFPEKKFVTVSPPGRNIAHHIFGHSDGKVSLPKEHIERALFPSIVFAEGKRAGRRPREYDTPPGWAPPP